MDQKYLEKAKLELRETDLRRSQSLNQFRSWLEKHPFLGHARQDDTHLLQFLRARKFNVADAMRTFERFYVSRRKYPQFFDSNEQEFKQFMRLIESGFCYPLTDRDSEGRKIILLTISKWDIEEFSVRDSIRAFLFVMNAVLEEEETQISGVMVIFDYSEVSLKKIVSAQDAIGMMDLIKNCSPTREKGHFFMNLPQFANFFIQIVKTGLSEKLKKRLWIVKDSNELKNFIDPKLLPKEYGGSRTQDEMLKEFLRYYEDHKEKILQVWNIKIDWNKVNVDEIWATDANGMAGSFRKLEID